MSNSESKTDIPISNSQPTTDKIIKYDPQTGVPIYDEQSPLTQEPASQATIPIVPPKKKSKAPLIIILCVLFFAIIAAGFLFILNGGLDTKKEKVLTGIKNTFSSISESSLNEYLGLTSLSKKMETGQYSTHFSLSLDDSSITDLEDFIGSGFSTNTIINIPESELSFSLSTFYADTDFLTADLYAYENNLSIACADIFDGYIQCQTEKFSDKFNDSELSTILDEEIYQDINFNIFDLFSNKEDSTDEIGVFIIENGKDITALYDSITITSMEPKIVTIDGKDKKCKQYDIIIPIDELSDVIDSYYEFLDDEYSTNFDYDTFEDSFKDDIQLHIAINKKNMVYLELVEYEMEDDTVFGSELSFIGKDSPIDIVEGTIFLSEDNEYGVDVEMDISIETETVKTTTSHISEIEIDNSSILIESEFDSKDGTTVLELSIDDLLNLSLEGNFEDIISGKSFTYVIEDLTLSYDDSYDTYAFNLSGDYGIDTDNSTPLKPSGTCYDLFTITEEDLETLYLNITETVGEDGLLSELFASAGIDLTNRITWDGYSNPFNLYSSYDFTTEGYQENIASDYEYYYALYEYNDSEYDLYNNISDFYGYDSFLEYIDLYTDGIQETYGLNFDEFIYEVYYFYTYDNTFINLTYYLNNSYLDDCGQLAFVDGTYDEIPVEGYSHEDFVEQNMMSILSEDYNYYMNFYKYYMEFYNWDTTFMDFPSYDDFFAFVQYYGYSNYEYRCTNDVNDVFDITDFMFELDAFFTSDVSNMDDHMEALYGDYQNW